MSEPGTQLSSPGRPRGIPTDRSSSSLVASVRGLARAEYGYAVLLLSAFVLPAWIGYRAWIPALALAIAVAALQGLLSGRRPLLPAMIIVYLGIYLVAGLHSDPDTFSVIEAGKYFAPPVLALAIAWACVASERTRRILIGLGLVAVAIQLPVVIGQVIDLKATFGHMATNQTDQIIGLLGTDQGAPLTQCALIAAVLCLAIGCVGWIDRRVALAAALAAISIGLLSSTRASYVFVPAALVTLAVCVWVARRRGAALSVGPLPAFALPVILLPVLYFGTAALYPGANDSLNSAGGVSASLSQGDRQLNGGESGGGGGGGGRQLTVLPGRGRQLTLALELSVKEGVDTTLLGRGIGSTRFKDQGLLSATGQTTDPITRPEQKTNAVWIARTISETGYLGLAAFLGLLGWMVALFWRNIDVLRQRSLDAAVILALPAVAALTLASATYNTILAIQPYATLFWAVLGVAIAIDAGRRSESRSAA